MARRVLGLAAAMLLVVVTACSGETPTPRAGGPGSAPTALEAAEAAVDSLGDDLTAALAVLLALDRGYTLAQVVDAIMGGDLRDTGVVVRSGAVVEPDGIPTDVIVDKSPPQARGATVLALGIVAGGPAVTEEEFIGHLIAWTLGLDAEFERQEALARAEAEERARQEQEEAAARAAQEAERLERLRTLAATLTVLDLSARGYSAEQIITAIVLGLVQCDAIPLPLPEWRCDIVGETPAEDEAGVFASEPATTTTTTVETTGAAPAAPIEDGVYAAEIEITSRALPTLVAMHQNEVIMEVRDGEYHLWITLEYVWDPCPSRSYEEFYGVGEVSTTHIVFRGTVSGSVTPGGTCTGGHSYEEHDWVHATVHFTPERYLECTCPLGRAYLVRVGD